MQIPNAIMVEMDGEYLRVAFGGTVRSMTERTRCHDMMAERVLDGCGDG